MRRASIRTGATEMRGMDPNESSGKRSGHSIVNALRVGPVSLLGVVVCFLSFFVVCFVQWF